MKIHHQTQPPLYENREIIMKVCPVCSESFADDLKFCDLDGTRLTRQSDNPEQQGQNKLWSMLGIGLLVGALVLSAVSVFLIPKSPVAPSVASSSSGNAAISKPASDPSTSAADNTTNAQPETAITESALPEAKKKDKAKALANENSDPSSLNPKAAAQGTDGAEKAAQPTETAAPARKPETEPAVKPAVETREVEPAPKPAASTEAKKDPKHPATDASKDSDKKKADDKDKDKKKGGFFRVFKKIFGKD